MAKRKVAVVVGSLRRGSFSRMTAKAMCGLAPGLECEVVEIGQLQLYNQDLDEGDPPAEWKRFRERIRGADGVLFVTPGALGAFGANHHLRQSLVFLDMPALQQPEAYLSGVAKWFDGEGKLTNDDARGFLEKFMEAFAAWIEKTAK